MSNSVDLKHELKTNFINYAASVNSDRSIPNAADGLKPVAKRILYGAYASGYSSKKPHVKCAKLVGDVMGSLHPHGDSSIYGALVRLAQPWVMRYPLMGFHGNMGNIDGDGPAAYRYTEARLAPLTEDGMLEGIKQNAVDFIPNYDESTTEPVELPSIFPNLLCNPNSGIGVATGCSWAPHNLREVAAAINQYINNEEPTLPGPDFPTGGVIINKDDIPSIMRTGHGSVKIRGKYAVDHQNIIFTEIPYGINLESLMDQIGKASDDETIKGIAHIRNESNKKGLRLVIECEKEFNPYTIVNQLFSKTDLQSSFSYNQIALIDKTPTELNLKDCIKIYIDYNTQCIKREVEFNINKAKQRLHIVEGLIKAIDIIDDIIAMIKASESAGAASLTLQSRWGFSVEQAQAILDMKLSKLAKLEKDALVTEKTELIAKIEELTQIFNNPIPELVKRLNALVKKYGDDRRTELTQIAETKGDKEVKDIAPEECVVIMTESELIKRIPSAAFRVQRRNSKGIKTKDDVITNVIRTNTVDNLMVFTNKGKMYRLIVDSIPVGTNLTQGVPIRTLVPLEDNEIPQVIYSIYRNTDTDFVLFTTKNGIVKKTLLKEYITTKRKNGIAAITIKEDDALASINLIKNENLILVTNMGQCIRIKSSDIGASGRTTMGVKGINLNKDDYVVSCWPIRNENDQLAIFSENGLGKKVPLKEFIVQTRGGKGVICYKPTSATGNIVASALISDEDRIVIFGNKNSLCINATEIPALNKFSVGNILIKNNKIQGVSKI